MDANNIDPGADEAVQRIRNSLNNMERTESHQKTVASDPQPQDPGADEAVQRIQSSITRIDAKAASYKKSQENPDALHGILEDLSLSAHLAMESSELYKKLASKDNVTGVLSEAVHEMIAVASTTTSILRDKYGIAVDREGYKLIKAIVTRYEEISEKAKAEGDPNWSARGLWEIERTLRGEPPVAEHVGTISENPDEVWEKYLSPEVREELLENARKKAEQFTEEDKANGSK